MRLLVVGLVAVSAWAAQACTTYQDDLNRSQRAFDQSEHERALAILRQLEPDMARLTVGDQAHYCFLRGMTDYRIGYKADSRHWLALAAAIEQATPGSLPPDSAKRMNESLKEMNETVYNGGIEALTNDTSKKPQGEEEVPRDSKDSQAAPDKADKTDNGEAAPPKKKPAKSDEN